MSDVRRDDDQEAPPRRGLRAYLESRAALDVARRDFDIPCPDPACQSEACEACVDAGRALYGALDGQFRAIRDLLPPSMRAALPANAPHRRLFEEPFPVDWLEDEFVWFPLLLDQHGGDRSAAETAWALGMRPTAFPRAASGASGGRP